MAVSARETPGVPSGLFLASGTPALVPSDLARIKICAHITDCRAESRRRVSLIPLQSAEPTYCGRALCPATAGTSKNLPDAKVALHRLTLGIKPKVGTQPGSPHLCSASGAATSGAPRATRRARHRAGYVSLIRPRPPLPLAMPPTAAVAPLRFVRDRPPLSLPSTDPAADSIRREAGNGSDHRRRASDKSRRREFWRGTRHGVQLVFSAFVSIPMTRACTGA